MVNYHIGNYTHVGPGNITQFIDISSISGAHLQDQHIVSCIQIVIDHLADTHGGIVAAGCHTDRVSLAEKSGDNKFRTGLAITSCNRNDSQIWERIQLLNRFFLEALLNRPLQWYCHPASQKYEKRDESIYKNQTEP